MSSSWLASCQEILAAGWEMDKWRTHLILIWVQRYGEVWTLLNVILFIVCYARWTTAWLTIQARVDLRNLPFPAGLLSLLVSDLPFCSLVAEDFNLAVGAVDGLVAAVVVAVGVDLQVQRKTLHTFLRGEVCAQAVDWDEDLWWENRGRRKETEKIEDVFKLKMAIFKNMKISSSFGNAADSADASFVVLYPPLVVKLGTTGTYFPTLGAPLFSRCKEEESLFKQKNLF